MATSIYLGMPPANVVRWIEKNVQSGPVFKDETQIVYTDGTIQEIKIEGELSEGMIPPSDNIKEIIIGNLVTAIGNDSLALQSELTSVYISNTVQYIGDYAFCSCKKLSLVSIGTNVTSIGDIAFEGCESLQRITLPINVTAVFYSFKDCTSLTEVNMLNDSIQLNGYVFINTKINSMPYQSANQIKNMFNNNNFGPGPGEYTITCKDGIVHATSPDMDTNWSIEIELF